MEVNVEGVHVGNSSVYHCTSAIFSKHSIKMTLSKPDDGQTENVLILKKNIVDLKSSELGPFPVICIKLKDKVCQKIAELLGVKFNSRSKDMTEVWMLIYYNFTSFEVPQFLVSNYIEKMNMLPFEELRKFIKLSFIKIMLGSVAMTIQSEREERGEPKAEICHKAKALLVPQEVRLKAKKFVNYIMDVREGCAVKGRDVDVKIDPEIFSACDLKQMTESYKNCLVCATCRKDAVQKCKGCEITRYCSRSCQDRNFIKHKQECSLLLMDRKKKEIQESLVMKQASVICMVDIEDNWDNWKNRILFKVWEKKFTYNVREGVREGIRQKEINACVHNVGTPS